MRFPDSIATAPSLKKMLSEATLALPGLDADRLEELAQSFEELTRISDWNGIELLRSSAVRVRPEVRIFNRTLRATAANRKVLLCLRGNSERLEYGSSWNSASSPSEGSSADD
jgi:hypothetical protein